MTTSPSKSPWLPGPPALPGDTLDAVDTPTLVLDLDAFEANLRAMQALADRHGVALRPHGKAHKCPEVALRQVALGAAGICCQKVSEALPFVAAGVADVHISNEVVGAPKLALLARLAGAARVSVCVDHPDALAALSQAMAGAGAQVGVLVDVDVGQGRCGVADPRDTVALARRAGELPGLRFAGIQAYHGAAQHVRAAAERRAAAAGAARQAAQHVHALREAGLDCPVVTGGGTGTSAFDAAGGVYTELQPGTYAFMDGDYGDNQWQGEPALRQALFLLATAMSTPAPGRAVVDAGLKSTTVESGLPRVHERPGCEYAQATDEHGVLRGEPAALPALGEKLRLVPSHCDPTFNLHDVLVAVRGGRVEALWPVSARGLSR